MIRKKRLSRWLFGMVILAVAECACFAALQIAISEPALAQSRQRRGGGFFQQLFGVPPQQRIDERIREPAPADYSRAPSTHKPDSKADPVEPTTSIVVMGDGMADWLAYGLEDAFSDEPEIAIVRESKAHSGLMRYDRKNDLDWWDAARDIIAKTKANYVVMMLGVSDRRNIREQDIEEDVEKEDVNKEQASKAGDAAGQQTIIAPEPKPAKKRNGIVEFRSDEWEKVYSRRIDRTVAALKSKGVPVFWVGLPSIRGTRSTADAVYLNNLYRTRAERAGAVYIDVWDGFVDESGKYSSYGPDYDGQVRRLRSGDGVYFSKYGARKIAHYVEREIRRYMSNRGPIALPSGPLGPVPADGKSAERPLAGPVLPLTMTQGNSDELLGGSRSSAVRGDVTATNVLVKGDAVTAPSGRADDFIWPRGSAADKPAEMPAAAIDKKVPAAAKSASVAAPLIVPAKPPEPLRPVNVTPKADAKPSAAPTSTLAKPESIMAPEPAMAKPETKPESKPSPSAAAKRSPERPPQAIAPRPPQPVRRSSDGGLFGANGPFGWIGNR